jgi:CHAT domain/WD domain, G-beta repeat
VGVVEVAIGPGRVPGRVRVEVVRSPAGEASAEASLDIDGLLARRDQFQQTLLASAVATRQVLSPAERAVRETGRMLFDALLGAGEVAGRYRASMALADERGEDLRVVLRLDAPELAGLPWEAMYDPGAGGYVCRQHQLVRHVPVAAVPPPLSVHGALRILGVIAAPRGLPMLDVGREREHLERALAALEGRALAGVTWVPEATWAGLHEMLMAGPWHVLHFVGHGDFDPGRDEGVLALEREDGRADLVEASRLADLLRQARPMPRLVVLNSCSGAATSIQDLFSGTAAALTRSGVAAVAAMQYAISDPAAVAFARGFYAALVRGLGIDQAVSAGRIAILGTSGHTLEWITPVLYLRGHNTRLFSVPLGPSRTPRSGTVRNPNATVSTDVPPVRGPSKPIRTLTGHTGMVNGLAFNSDGTVIATTSSDKTARLWDATTGTLVRTLTGHTEKVVGVAFSPDDKLIATASADRTARLWDAATGTPVRTLTGHKKSLQGIAFSPDGRLLATGSWDKTIGLWDTATGTRVGSLIGHTSGVVGVAFSPDRNTLASLGADGAVRLWDTATGTRIGSLIRELRGVRESFFERLRAAFNGDEIGAYGVAFSPDGALLATANLDKTVQLWA